VTAAFIHSFLDERQKLGRNLASLCSYKLIDGQTDMHTILQFSYWPHMWFPNCLRTTLVFPEVLRYRNRVMAVPSQFADNIKLVDRIFSMLHFSHNLLSVRNHIFQLRLRKNKVQKQTGCTARNVGLDSVVKYHT
jgi:hypothetical protein